VITRLNLASNPFRNRTLPWTVAVVISAVSLLALVYILAQYRDASAKAAAAETQVATMSAERDRLLKHADEIRQNIPPEQLKTLDAAHALVSRKSFSWSQLFSDLEEVLPASVRVARINVRDVTQFGDQTRASGRDGHDGQDESRGHFQRHTHDGESEVGARRDGLRVGSARRLRAAYAPSLGSLE
jgi:Tfp pilus assembly protein PilN